MTCVIGYFDKKTNSVWIGADSLGSNGYTKAVNNTSKVFRNATYENLIIGGTTTFRHLDLLRYADALFDELDVYKKPEIDHKYMVTKFIPKVIALFKDGIIDEPETRRGGNFIVGINDKLYEVQGDYSVLEPQLGVCAVGCGEDVAMGSLLTTYDMDFAIPDKIKMALAAAESSCCGVQRPFRIINTMTKDEIIIT